VRPEVSRPALPMQTIRVLAITYGAFYFCRSNLAAAVPGIKAELALDNAEMGLVLASSKLVYGIGQLVNGQLAERVSARRMLAVGMLGSAALNLVFGFGAAVELLVFVWALNGYAQALGWTPTMKVASSWLAPAERGRAIGIIGTGYQAAAALTFVISGFAVEHFGWRGALWLPALLLAAAAVYMLVALRERPEYGEASAARIAPATALPLGRSIVLTLGNPSLWLLALALGLLNANRYGFLDWGITHVTESGSSGGIGEAALEYAVLPAGGIAGALTSGWASDRFFDGRRAPVLVGSLVALALLTLVYRDAVALGVLPIILCLFAIGFVLFGAQVLLVGTAPVDLAHPGTQAAAVGLVNFAGYMGAYAGDRVTGTLADAHGWGTAVAFWAACAAGAALCVALLWNRRA
jgi:sugar phosphate permease